MLSTTSLRNLVRRSSILTPSNSTFYHNYILKSFLKPSSLGFSSVAASNYTDTMFDTNLTCGSCGGKHEGFPSPIFKCPHAATNTTIDHVLMPSPLSPADLTGLKSLATPQTSTSSPFVKYRALLFPYRVAMSNGMSDVEYCKIVTELDDAIKAISGTGFAPTPLLEGSWGEEKVREKPLGNHSL